MNAYELYDAVFDSANDYAEPTIEYIQEYADGAYEIPVYVSDAVAQKMLDCRAACIKANEENGEYSNNHYHHIQAPLEAIEL